MTESKKPFTVEFAPGAFDSFDGTQEELDQLMIEIQDMFTKMTPEELAESSRRVTLDDLDDLEEEDRDAILRALEDFDSEERQQKLN